MSWVQRKLDGSDDYDQAQVIKEYFENKKKQKLLEEQAQAEQIKKFWAEYKEDQQNG